MSLLVVFLTLWYITGVWSFIWLWLHEYDYTTDEILSTLFCGIGGPILFLFGWWEYTLQKRKKPPPRVLIKKERK